MNERGVASSVRSLDLDVSLDHLTAKIGCRCRCYGSGNACAHQEGGKVAPCDVSVMRLVRRLTFRVVCHGFSLQRVYRISLEDCTVRSFLRCGRTRSAVGLASCKDCKEPAIARHSGNRNKIELIDYDRANHNRMPQALPSPESLPDPSRWALFLMPNPKGNRCGVI